MLNDPNKRFQLGRWVSRSYKRNGVPETPELHRILDLPRRVWEERPDLEQFTQALTRYLKKPKGTQVLWPHQAVALEEAHDLDGALGPIPVGEGKTLISYLLPVVFEEEVERPLLTVPGNLRDKTHREFAAFARDWRGHPGLQVQSYEKLSRAGGTEYLKKYQPDLLIFDEAHRLKNPSAAVTRKVRQWMEAYPETKIVLMSGTVTKRSLLDFAHMLRWALPRGCPLPMIESELEAWAAAVDEIRNYEQRESTSPGALVAFCNDLERTQGLMGIRTAIRRRIQETPGVVAVQGRSKVAASLNITLHLVDNYNKRVRDIAKGLNEGVLPNGEVYLVEGKENSLQALQCRWRVFRTITSGFWLEEDPPGPEHWKEARSRWKKIVKNVLEEYLPGLESEALITQAAMRGKLSAEAKSALEAWNAVRGDHTPSNVAVWEDDCVIEWIERWTKKNSGLVWVNEVALGERLEEVLGLPYFHNLGRDRLGRPVESMQPSGGSVVLSVGSNSMGRNLQHWDKNVVISPMPMGDAWQQLMARTHRPGQESDEVSVEVLFGCRVEWQCWQQAVRDSHYQDAMEGPRKLFMATVDQKFKVPRSDGALW